jgi:hypothetical protein
MATALERWGFQVGVSLECWNSLLWSPEPGKHDCSHFPVQRFLCCACEWIPNSEERLPCCFPVQHSTAGFLECIFLQVGAPVSWWGCLPVGWHSPSSWGRQDCLSPSSVLMQLLPAMPAIHVMWARLLPESSCCKLWVAHSM